jgi:hypothetical protein
MHCLWQTADLLQRYQRASGQSPSAGAAQNTSDALKTAVQVAKLRETSVIDGGNLIMPGSLLDTFAQLVASGFPRG